MLVHPFFRLILTIACLQGGCKGLGIIIGANTRNIEKHVHRVKHTDANIQLDSNER